MIDENTKGNIHRLAGKYPCSESAILPALNLIQRNNGFISREDMAGLARILGFPESRVFSVASYYSRFRLRSMGKYHIQVCSNVSCFLSGSDQLYQHMSSRLGIGEREVTEDGIFSIEKVECLGSCGYGPSMQINCTHFENLDMKTVDRIINNLRKTHELLPITSSHRAMAWESDKSILLRPIAGEDEDISGYPALKKALSLSPEKIIDMVVRSGLRGRGGAGFPSGVKWSFLPSDRKHTVYLICNADEGEPGTFKDREIMEFDPHLLIEGMTITAYAVGSHHGFIYIRGEYNWIAMILIRAISDAISEGYLGNNIMGSGFSFYIDVYRGAGSYVCGEETALMESVEGKRGQPRIKPPFPAQQGLYGEPTVVHNVTTLSIIPYIIKNGPDASCAIHKDGTKLFGISGHVKRPGLYEYPMGTPLKKIIFEAADGIRNDRQLKAVIPGGLSSPILTANEIDIPLDFESLLEAGSMLGSGGIIVFDEYTSIPMIAMRTAKFFAHESCGQCTPCREGTAMIKCLIDRLINGYGTKNDIEQILRLCKSIKGSTICAFGDAVTMSVEAMIIKFRNEFEALLKSKKIEVIS